MKNTVLAALSALFVLCVLCPGIVAAGEALPVFG